MTLTVVSSPRCAGEVTSNPHQSDWKFYPTDNVVLQAVAQPGYVFVNWTGDVDGATDTTQKTITVEMSGYYEAGKKDLLVTANFMAPGGLSCDNTSPSTPVVTDDGVGTTDATQLHVTWTSSDNESDVVEYQYAVGTSPGATDVVGWTSAGTATEISHTGLSLSPGTKYYVSVKARNGVGLWSEVGSTDGIVCDNTPPTIPVVTDGGERTTNNTELHAAWSSADGESDVLEYQYAIGTSPGAIDVVGWTSAGTATEITHTGLGLDRGTTYYISVKAKNGAGLWSEVGSSDGIVPRASGAAGLPLFGWIGIGVAAAVLTVGAVAYLVVRRGAAKP